MLRLNLSLLSLWPRDEEQLLPELDDDFAKEIKREEQFKQAGRFISKCFLVPEESCKCVHFTNHHNPSSVLRQAGTAEGIPEEEEGIAEARMFPMPCGECGEHTQQRISLSAGHSADP